MRVAHSQHVLQDSVCKDAKRVAIRECFPHHGAKASAAAGEVKAAGGAKSRARLQGKPPQAAAVKAKVEQGGAAEALAP